ncbi:MAG TPA: hypothetical protein PLA97_01490 [Rubrivivax sp.]|nr:hypothetical protein [Rubrivivax sp.]
MLRLVGDALFGEVNGQTVNGRARTGPGATLATGRYRLLLPVDDPVFGTVVLAVPQGLTPMGLSYDLKNVMVSSSLQKGLPGGSVAFCERQLPGVPTVVVYNGHAGLVMAARAAAGQGELTVT